MRPPPSLRFLGRKVYLATVVTLISAMLHGTNAGTPDASFDRGGDRSPNPRALARLVAFDLYRRTLRAGRQGHLHAAGRHRQPASLAARSLCWRHRRAAHLLAAIRRAAD